MIGFILVAVSWILLRIEGKGLGAIGFNAPRLRLREFSAGFLVAGAAAALQQLGYSLATATPWQLNPERPSGSTTGSLTVCWETQVRWRSSSCSREPSV